MLANGPNIAPHYFIVDRSQERTKTSDWKTKRKKRKTFKHVLFMQCAGTLLHVYMLTWFKSIGVKIFEKSREKRN